MKQVDGTPELTRSEWDALASDRDVERSPGPRNGGTIEPVSEHQIVARDVVVIERKAITLREQRVLRRLKEVPEQYLVVTLHIEAEPIDRFDLKAQPQPVEIQGEVLHRRNHRSRARQEVQIGSRDHPPRGPGHVLRRGGP